MNRDNISQIVKEKILYQGLNLVNLDIELKDLEDSRTLFGPQGIGIDSIDSLEILMGIKKHFNLEIPNANVEFFETYFNSVGGIIDYVEEKLNAENTK